MLKKKTLTETVYNNGDPFQIREAISACIGAWQKREDVQVLWETLKIEMNYDDYRGCWEKTEESYGFFEISAEAVYDAGN